MGNNNIHEGFGTLLGGFKVRRTDITKLQSFFFRKFANTTKGW